MKQQTQNTLIACPFGANTHIVILTEGGNTYGTCMLASAARGYRVYSRVMKEAGCPKPSYECKYADGDAINLH